MEDGSVVNTDKASQSWDEGLEWNGSNQISRATRSQWAHETLYRSRKGRFYKICVSNYADAHTHAEWVDDREAVVWMLVNEKVVPNELKHLVSEVEE